MQARTRTVIMVLCTIAAAGSVVAYVATGAYPYTRFRDKELERVNSQTDLSDLFSAAGPSEARPPKAVESVNAIGLLPSGPGLAFFSVATIAGPAIGVMGVLSWLERRRGRRAHAGEAGTGNPPVS